MHRVKATAKKRSPMWERRRSLCDYLPPLMCANTWRDVVHWMKGWAICPSQRSLLGFFLFLFLSFHRHRKEVITVKRNWFRLCKLSLVSNWRKRKQKKKTRKKKTRGDRAQQSSQDCFDQLDLLQCFTDNNVKKFCPITYLFMFLIIVTLKSCR